jgi:hypothetical protein
MHVTGAADVDGAGLTSPGAACAVASPGADVGTVVAQMLGQSWCRCWDSPGADVHHRQSGQHTEDGLGAEHEARARKQAAVCAERGNTLFRYCCRALLVISGWNVVSCSSESLANSPLFVWFGRSLSSPRGCAPSGLPAEGLAHHARVVGSSEGAR